MKPELRGEVAVAIAFEFAIRIPKSAIRVFDNLMLPR